MSAARSIVVLATVMILAIAEARYFDDYKPHRDPNRPTKNSLSSLLSSYIPHKDYSRTKRMTFDEQCNGIYDWKFLRELDVVCTNCHNLYRGGFIGDVCREDCFNNPIFRGCLNDLMLHEEVPQYREKVLMLGKR